MRVLGVAHAVPAMHFSLPLTIAYGKERPGEEERTKGLA